MTILCDGHPVMVKFVSRNKYMDLYQRCDTKVCLTDNGYYLYNIYSDTFPVFGNKVKFHKKLKIYASQEYGCYVKCQGIRCYMNDLLTQAQKEDITGMRYYYND